MTDARHPDRASEQRGRAATHATSEVAAIALTLGVGAAWYLVAANSQEGWFGYDLLFILTLGLAIAFGASMSTVRGFVMSTLLAAATIIGRALGEGDVIGRAFGGAGLGGDGTIDPAGVLSFWLVAVLGTAMLVLAFWLIGVTIVTMWHGSVGRLVQQAFRGGPRR